MVETTLEELKNNINQIQGNELQERIKKIDTILLDRLSDWIGDELKYFRKENPDCTEEMSELIVGDYYKKSPLIKYFNEYLNNRNVN